MLQLLCLWFRDALQAKFHKQGSIFVIFAPKREGYGRKEEAYFGLQ